MVGSVRERVGVVGLCPMAGEQPCAMGLLSWTPETTAFSVALIAAPALEADKVSQRVT